ncbi:MAG: hypothetical protein PVH95_11380 [Anaerolineae bacterium]|jgi:hypothetical protein
MARGSIAIEADKTSAARGRFLRILLASGAVFVALICLGIIAAEAWDYTNSVAFCADTCHDVHPEEPLANQDSYHARIKCTECHMGRVSMVEGVVLKTSHIRHLPAIIFDSYERPLLSESMRPASESCEQCHFPAAFHDAMAREIEHFLPDADNTGKLTYLLLRTGAGTEDAEQGYGIHWHITNPVEYIATDETKQEIRWVRKTLPDGSTIEYNDASNPLSAEEIAQAEVRTMDCVDCHNRIGHPFPSPDELIDQALAEGRLSTDLPYAKREMLALLNATYATQEEALAAADSLRARYNTEYPEIAAAYAAEIEQAVRLARELQTRLVFEEPGVTWQSFSDNTGHSNSDGCFRCHDGQLVSSEDSAISLECNLCHSIPVTVNLGDTPPEIAIPALEEPETHLDTRFVSKHRFQVDESCTDCHGEVRYGTDDSSFCANSACHGQNWPTLSLDESFAHPVSLEGQHAEATCDSCHNGAPEIPQDCAGCHAPPVDHLNGTCETCHAPAGWTEIAVSDVMVGDSMPHNVAPAEDCTACHDPYRQDWPAPIDHIGYSNAQCDVCHDVADPVTITWDATMTGHLLQGEHVWVSCVECHQDATFRGTPEDCASCHVDDDTHAGEMGEACADCHIPAGWTQAAIDHAATAFPLNGQHQDVACLDCHVDSTYEGTPQDCWSCHQTDDIHTEQLGRDCAECHAPNGWQGATFAHGSTAYPLRGEHKQAACVECHVENQYSGTPQNCYACHQTEDAHNGQLGQACAQCHAPRGWTAVTFDHNASVYPLTGQHGQVACSQCHAGGQYAGTPQNCYACHQTDDRHNGQFGQNCAQCHGTSGWQGASFDHNTTSYSLTGRHAQVSCVQCHAGDQYSGTPTNCSACHQADDRHSGQFGQNCAECHSTGGWQGASLDHNRTAFPLTGAHAGLGCASCHGGGVYDGTPTSCSACHGEPGYHAGVLGSSCASCHDTGGWLPARYDRGHSFNMYHEDSDGSCRTCHPNTLTSTSCSACHDGPPDDDDDDDD